MPDESRVNRKSETKMLMLCIIALRDAKGRSDELINTYLERKVNGHGKDCQPHTSHRRSTREHRRRCEV